jgi:peptide deformylase
MANPDAVKAKLLPIIAYGHGVLRQVSTKIEKKNLDLKILVDSLWNTLEISGGVGLAAPQINSEKSVFVVDSKLYFNELSAEQREVLFPDDEGIKQVFINSQIINKSEPDWTEVEGCLSIPGIFEPVTRSWKIEIAYQDEEMNSHCREFSGYTAKVIQHEYDHTQGILFIDHLSGLKKKILKSKLIKVWKGKVETSYPITFIKNI